MSLAPRRIGGLGCVRLEEVRTPNRISLLGCEEGVQHAAWLSRQARTLPPSVTSLSELLDSYCAPAGTLNADH